MRTAIIDKQISTYLGKLNVKEKEAILGMVKTFVENKEADATEEKGFIAELDRRVAEFESGNAKTFTLDQLEARARKAYKSTSKAD